MALPIWRAGEHMAVIGQTGEGKSVLISSLLSLTRQHYVVLKSKADSVKYPGAKTVASAAAMRDSRASRLVLRPQPNRETQRREFSKALQLVWTDGGWTVAVDDLYYVEERLGLGEPLDILLTNGREPGKISVCTALQRPTKVSRFAIGEARHVISFGLEGRDTTILRDATNARFAEVVTGLDVHCFAWLHKPRTIWVGKINLQTGKYIGRMAA
jgi:energy-coupling factor transporter ATP-binding protein EcfA2